METKHFGVNTSDLVPSKGVPRGWAHQMQLAVMKDLDAFIVENSLLPTSATNVLPFDYVVVEIQHGIRNETTPRHDSILPDYRCLPLIIEVDVEELRQASKDAIYSIYERASLLALIHGFKKYNLDCSALEERLPSNEAN